MKRCEIVRDLLPLYVDGVASEESAGLIREHVAGCDQCRCLLERMTAPVEAAPAEDGGLRNALRQQRHRAARKTWLAAMAALLLGAAVVLTALWSKGVFCIADRQTSPDGQTVTTAYSKDVTGLFPKSGGFTIRDKGHFRGDTVYLNAAFEGMWWSPDGSYLVIAMEREGEPHLEALDYVRNTRNNLDNRLDSAIYGRPEFAGMPYPEPGRPAIAYQFLQWSDYDNAMLVAFSYVDTGGVDRSGYFWYDYDSGEASGIMELPTLTAVGVVKSRGTRSDGQTFYTMDLLEQDENGNTVEFVFHITAATRLPEPVAVGDTVQVVYREDPRAYNFPAISVTKP